MDAPPPGENVTPFARIAQYLRTHQYSAPEIQALDEASGFMLLEDFGDDTFTRLLETHGDPPESTLYGVAVDFLTDLHGRPPPSDVARYDSEKCVSDAQLFVACFLEAEKAGNEALYQSFDDAWRAILPHATSLPYALSLRDFHAGNLMWLPERAGLRRLGLLDFQDALAAPIAYDLVSLLQDARRDVGCEAPMIERYLAANPTLNEATFRAGYAVLGMLRGLRIVGVFARLAQRGKPEYLSFLPRVWRHVNACARHEAAAPMNAWLDAHVPHQRHG